MNECFLIDCRGCSPEMYQGALTLIPQERRELAESYRHFSDKVMSAVSGMCQTFASNRFFCGIVRDANGKPQCTDGLHHFNISHSGSYVLFALADDPVGVDVQTIIKETSVSGAVLCENEKQHLGADIDSSELTALWCRKEAYLKMTGFGLSTDPKTLDVFDADLLPEGYAFYESECDGARYCIVHKGDMQPKSIGMEEFMQIVEFSL